MAAFRPMRIDFTPPLVSGTFASPPSIVGRGFTLDQLLQLQAASQSAHHGHSFWDAVKAGGHGLSYIFDKILRPSYGVASGVDAAVTKRGHFDVGEFLHGFREGFMGRNKEGFGQVLEHQGILQGHRTLRGLVGFGTDVITDPTTALQIAAAPVTGGASLAPMLARLGVRGAEEAVAKQTAFKAGKAFLDEAFTAHTSEEAAQQLPRAQQALHDLTTGTTTFDQRRALGVATVNSLKKLATGEGLSPVDIYDLNNFKRGALEEELAKTPKALQLRAQIPFTNKSAPLTPALIPVPKRLARAPKVTSVITKAFRPGAENPEMHGLEMVARHGAEQLSHDYINFTQQQFKGIHLGVDQQLEALGRFEEKGGVLKRVDKATGQTHYELNPDRFTGLTNEQQAFVRAWHNVTEHIRQRDEMFGVKYKSAPIGERGQLYIPHMVARDDISFGGSSRQTVISKLSGERGFQMPRKGAGTVAQLKAVHEMGKTPKDIITNPMELLARRVTASAAKQADQRLVYSLTKVMGLPARKVNGAEVTKAQRALDAVNKQLADIKPLKPKERAALHQELKDLRIKDIHAAHDAELERLQKGHNRIKFGPKTRTKNATLARYKKAMDAIPAKREAAVQAVHAGEDTSLKRIAATVDVGEKTKRVQVRELTKQADQLSKALAKAQKGVKNPEIENMVKAGWIKPQGFDHYFPPKVASQLTRVLSAYKGDDEVINALGKTYAKYLSGWKLLVTSVNPGYRLRNTLSDFWNMWVAGVPTRAIVHYGFSAARLMRNAKTGAEKMAAGKTLSRSETAALRELNDAYAQGVLSGLFQGDIQSIRSYLEHHGSKKALVKEKRFLALGTKVAQDLNRNAENWGRMVHYLYRRQGQHMGVARAAREVRIAHFDYEDLTEFERKKAKAILPFYTWTRKNIPFQLRQLASRPGRYSAFPKFAMESEYAAGGSDGDILPGWMQQQFSFKTPWGYMTPQIGAADLTVFNGGATQRLLGMITPFAKIPAEIATGKNLGTGLPLHSETHPREPISDFAASVLGGIPGNPLNVGMTERGGIRGEGANWIASYAASQMPFTNWLVNQRSTIRQQQHGRSPDLGYLTGLSLRNLDNAAAVEAMMIQIQDLVKKQKRGLRDEGVIPEAKTRNSPFDQYLRQVLTQSLGR